MRFRRWEKQKNQREREDAELYWLKKRALFRHLCWRRRMPHHNMSVIVRSALEALAKSFLFCVSASSLKLSHALNAAWPGPLRKASGFPQLYKNSCGYPAPEAEPQSYVGRRPQSQRLSARVAAKPASKHSSFILLSACPQTSEEALN